MELLLWRWSTAVQVTSALTLAVFFTVLARSVRRPELRLWNLAWLANFGAISIALIFWFFQPEGVVAFLVRAGYLAGKTAFIVLLIDGAWASVHAGQTVLTGRRRAAFVVLFALVGGLFLSSIPLLGLVQHSVIAVLLLTAAVASTRVRDRWMIWLAAAFLVRGVLAATEAAAYAIRSLPESANQFLYQPAGFLISTSSSWDTGAEWLLALGCVLVVSGRIQRELRLSNQDLVSAQEELRTLADRDALTGLYNRRSLPALLRAVQPAGAKLLFFDLDGFKGINDSLGHHVGDLCLKRFGEALRACFRPDDGVVRYAGDEFLVIASGLGSDAIDERVATLRGKLSEHQLETPPIGFSVGVAELAPGGVPDEALKAADSAMYGRKMMRRRAASA